MASESHLKSDSISFLSSSTPDDMVLCVTGGMLWGTFPESSVPSNFLGMAADPLRVNMLISNDHRKLCQVRPWAWMSTNKATDALHRPWRKA